MPCDDSDFSSINKSHIKLLVDKLLKNLTGLKFFSDYQEKRILHIDRQYLEEEIADIFPLKKFDEVLTSGGLMAPNLDIVINGRKVSAPVTVSPSPGTDVEYLLKELRNGSSVRIAHVEQYLPSVMEFCRLFEQQLYTPFRANLYMTPPFSKGFEPHYDQDDNYIIQVFGKKKWLYHPAYSNQVDLPSRDMTCNFNKHKPFGMPEEIHLNLGDVLYFPRGFMHEASTDDAVSIHITLAAIEMTREDFIIRVIKNLSKKDIYFRQMMSFHEYKKSNYEQMLEIISKKLSNISSIKDVEENIKSAIKQHRIKDFSGQIISGITSGFSETVIE